ncbi:MAG: hypothetical protein M3252_02820 [Actinomycetota bacterium]|nr:hypothetical protein [Actinomycetota bacterium]
MTEYLFSFSPDAQGKFLQVMSTLIGSAIRVKDRDGHSISGELVKVREEAIYLETYGADDTPMFTGQGAIGIEMIRAIHVFGEATVPREAT